VIRQLLDKRRKGEGVMVWGREGTPGEERRGGAREGSSPGEKNLRADLLNKV